VRTLGARSGSVAARRSFQTTRPARAEVDEDAFFSELNSDISGHDARMELAAMQRTLRQVDMMGAAAKEAPKTIDFAYYRSAISRPGVVDEAEKATNDALKQIESMTFDVAAMVKESDSKLDALITKAEQLAVESVSEKKKLEAELAAVRAEKLSVADMVISEELKKNPEMAAEIEKEINEDKWFVL